MAREQRFNEGVYFRAPPGFNNELQQLADERCTTVANLIRQTLAQALTEAGLRSPAHARDRSRAPSNSPQGA